MSNIIGPGSRRGMGMARGLGLVLVALSLLEVGSAGPAWADGDTCAGAYEKAQEERAAGRLRSSLAQLRLCVAPVCAAFMRADCSRWMDEVEPAIPSVVFAVRRGGHEMTRVRVACDGVALEQALEGKAVAVDPGRHTLSFVAADDPRPVTTEITIRQGEQNRLIEIELPEAPAVGNEAVGAATEPSVVPERASRDGGQNARFEGRARSPWPYVAAAIGAAGVVGFTTFALLGHDKEASLANSCKPSCSSSDVAPVRLDYRLADVSLGIGLVAAGVATYLFVMRPPATGAGSSPQRTAFSAAPRIFANGAGLGASGTF